MKKKNSVQKSATRGKALVHKSKPPETFAEMCNALNEGRHVPRGLARHVRELKKELFT